MKRRLPVLAMAAGLLLGSGCTPKSEEPGREGPAREAEAAKVPRPSKDHSWTGEEIVFLKEKFGELQHSASGLYFKVLQPGEGEEKPPRGKLCAVRYRGTFLNDKVFDERLKSPFKFRVGIGQVIRGWDEAVADMRRGEKRLVVVPYWLGYGEQGKVPYIMPRTTLVFEIELEGWETTTGIPVAPAAH